MQATKCAGVGCKINEHVRCGISDDADAARLENARLRQVYRRGDRIFTQAEMASGLYCLQSGHVLLWYLDPFGHRTAFRVAGPGEIMGHRSLFGEDPHAATAEALTTCHICWYPKGLVDELIGTYPSFARRFLRTLARDRGPPDALLLRGLHMPIRVRLVYLLLILRERHGEIWRDGSLHLELPLLRRDIASLLGARPESVTRAIQDLKRDGVATFNGRHVVVSNLEALYNEANQEYDLGLPDSEEIAHSG